MNNCSLRGCETQRKITLDYQSRHNPLFPRHSPPRFRLSFQSNQKFARSCDIRREQTDAIISSTASSTLAGTVIFGSGRTRSPPILRHAGQREIEFPVKTGNPVCSALNRSEPSGFRGASPRGRYLGHRYQSLMRSRSVKAASVSRDRRGCITSFRPPGH